MEESTAAGSVGESKRLHVPTHIQHVSSSNQLLSSDGESDYSRSGLEYFDMDSLVAPSWKYDLESGIEDDLESACSPWAGHTNFGIKPLKAKELQNSDCDGECMEEISTLEKWKRMSAPVVIFLILGIIILIWGRGHLNQLLQWLGDLPLHQSLPVFICLFTLISFPFGFGYIILNMMSGYLYGLVKGQSIVMVSVVVGSSISFLLCRMWFKDYARSLVTSSKALQAVLKVVEGRHGFKVIFLTRFTPIPFGLQNVLFAITSVSYLQFISASMLGLLPTQLLNTYMGSTFRNMQEVLSDRVDGYIILGIQVIFSILLMLYILHKARKELAKLAQDVDVESGMCES